MTSASGLERRDAALDNAPGRGFIYAIICLTNQKRYIGQAVNFNRRIWTHRSNLRNKRHWCPDLQNDWNTFGPDSFSFQILEMAPREKLKIVEAKYILEAITKLSGCYNYMVAVDDTGKLTPISGLRKRQSEAIKKAWLDPTTFLRRPMRTRWDDPEQKAIQSDSQKRRYADPEERRKTAEATKLGQTEDVRRRKSEKAKASWKDPNTRQRRVVRVISKEGLQSKSEKMRAYWASPEGQAEKLRKAEKIRAYWSDPNSSLRNRKTKSNA